MRHRPRLSVANAFALAFLACGAVVIVAYGWFVAQRETARHEASILDDLVVMGAALEPAVVEVREREGDGRAQEVVLRSTHENQEVLVRWAWLDVPTGSAEAPRVPMREEARWREIVTVEGRPHAFVLRRLPSAPSLRPVALELSRPIPPDVAFVRDAILSEVAAAGLIALLTAVVARLLGQWLIGGPLGRVILQARAVGAGNLDDRLDLRGTKEIFEVKAELNAMCDQLQVARERVESETHARVVALEQLRHADRLRTVGTLASGIAHELGTPLNVILLRAKMLKRTGGEVAEGAGVIAGQAERMTRIVRQLLDFARRKEPKRSRCDLVDVAEHTTSLLRTLAERADVTLRLDRPEAPLLAKVDPAQLEQALTNLVVNAVQASRAGGEVVVTADRREVETPSGEPRALACLEVRDEGTGIAPADLERIFEPFFTTKGVGEGTGLGLAVAHGIVDDHGGFIRASSAPGAGTTFAIYVPMEKAT